MTTRERVIECAMSWCFTPFHHYAAIKGVAVDCAHLLLEAHVEAGLINRFKLPEYSAQWALHRDRERFIEIVTQYAREVPIGKPADIALFKFGRCYSHGAILIDDEYLIHAYVKRRVEVCERSDPELATQPVRYFTVFPDGR